MVKCGVLFEVRTEFLNIIKTSFAISCHAALLILNSSKLSPVVVPPIYLFSKFRCLFEATPITIRLHFHIIPYQKDEWT
jgi:hypothetical protein